MIGTFIGAPIGGVINYQTGNTGFVAVTLDDATGNATGTLAISGQVSATLDDATLIATGALALTGSAGITLSDVTIAATGSLDIAGEVGTHLDDATLSAAMARDPHAVLGIVLDDATLSAAMARDPHAVLGIVLEDASCFARGEYRAINITIPPARSRQITGSLKNFDCITTSSFGLPGSITMAVAKNTDITTSKTLSRNITS